MGILSRIRSLFTSSAKSRRVKGGYDSAQTTDENLNHWANTDNYSANAGMDSGTRSILRERSRYERDNNSYYRGLVETRASDLVGTGPRLQLQLPNDPTRRLSKQIERAFARWARAVDLPEKLRLMEKAGVVDGESFGVKITNDLLPNTGLTNVTLDLRLYEADQCTDPWDFGFDPLYTDGVRYDERGNVESYTFLKQHPGGVTPFVTWETTTIPAESVIHWYRPGRVGQHRGIPEMQAALPLFAQLRRYTLATLTAAETAAMLAGVMKSNLSPESGEANDESTFDKIPMARGTLLTLPPGWEASQFKPEQPTGTYKDFKGELLNEIGRTINMPFNVIAGNSSGYNYSSGRLDHQGYHRGIEVDRSRLRARVIDPLFLAWVEEAALAGEIPAALPPLSEWSWDWFFDGFTSIDPLKEANADRVNLGNGSTTLSEIYAAKGMDWEDALRQRAIETKLAQELGLTLSELAPTIPDEGEQAIPGVQARRIRAAWDESKHPRAEDGKFGEGSGGGESAGSGKSAGSAKTTTGGTDHKAAADEARKAAKEHADKAKQAKADGNHELAKEHKRAERAQTRKAAVSEALHKANEDHAKQNAELDQKISEAKQKADDAEKRHAEVSKQHEEAKQSIADLKRQLAESKAREKAIKKARSGA